MDRPAPHATSRQRQRGFTFIEVLVVMGIIAVIAGLSVVAMQLVSSRGPQFKTQTRVRRVSLSTSAWKQKWRRLPPSDANALGKFLPFEKGVNLVPDSFNNGIEALYLALSHEASGIDAELSDNELGNTDEDKYDKPIKGVGETPYEVIDAWGNPLVYFVNTEYATALDSPPSYLLGDGTEVTPVPWKYEDETRGFAQPHGFQIFSMGADGEPNTDDDIKSWE